MDFLPDHAGVVVRPSPNFGQRCGVDAVTFLILHYTGMENADVAERHLCDPAAQVSAHYLLREDGTIIQMVAEGARAWHAGSSHWAGMDDINSRSIGIELVNGGPVHNFPDYPHQQIEALIDLCQGILARHPIKPHHVLAHSDIAPARKIDPGEKFPWGQLAQAGIGHYVPPSPIAGGRFMMCGDKGQPIEAYQSMLALYGYKIEITGLFDEETELVTYAFQRHFRPQKVDGIADKSTIETLHRLLACLPKQKI